MNTCWKEWCQNNLLLHRNNMWPNESNLLYFKKEFYIDLGKITSFDKFNKEQVPIILEELHYGVDGRHFSSNITTQIFWCWLLVAHHEPKCSWIFQKMWSMSTNRYFVDSKLGKIGNHFTWKNISKLGFRLHWTNQTCKQVFKQLVHFSKPWLRN